MLILQWLLLSIKKEMKQHLTAFCLFIDRYDITKFRSKILNTSSDIAETIHKFYLFFHFKISRDHPQSS